MICPKCGGGGKVDCTMCKGTGLYHEEDGMTNEEWFCGLSMEEKAEVLANKCRHAYVNYVPSKGTVSNQEWWESWLKEVHKE